MKKAQKNVFQSHQEPSDSYLGMCVALVVLFMLDLGVDQMWLLGKCRLAQRTLVTFSYRHKICLS